MPTLNIRNLDHALYDQIKAASKREGVSINKLVKAVLSRVFLPNKVSEYHDLDGFFGTWTDQDHEAVVGASREARAIDEELWR